MELQKLTNYVNIRLKNELNFREKYYLNVDRENNTIQIRTLFPLAKGNLFQIFQSDNDKGRNFIESVLNILKQYDKNIEYITLSIDIQDNKPIGLTILCIRNENLINELEPFPIEIINSIVSLCNMIDIKSFGTTCKEYYKLINDKTFWIHKCGNILRIGYKAITDIVGKVDKTFDYKSFIKYVYNFNQEKLVGEYDIFSSESVNFFPNYIKILLQIKNFYTSYEYQTLFNYMTSPSKKDKSTLERIEILNIINENYDIKLFRKYKFHIEEFFTYYNKKELINNFIK